MPLLVDADTEEDAVRLASSEANVCGKSGLVSSTGVLLEMRPPQPSARYVNLLMKLLIV